MPVTGQVLALLEPAGGLRLAGIVLGFAVGVLGPVLGPLWLRRTIRRRGRAGR
jgi:hypothetical protein